VSGSAGWFAVVGPVTGFTVAPGAGAAKDLLNVTSHSWLFLTGAVGGAAACGMVVAVTWPARYARIAIGCGLSLAAAGFAAGYVVSLTGLAGQRGQLLALAWAPVAGGLTVALATALRRTGAAGAMCGAVLLLAGVLAGYLADGAIELQALSAGYHSAAAAGAGQFGAAAAGPGRFGAAAVRAALVTADSRWNIAAAALTAAVALAAFAQARLRGRRKD
jgi:hypothetical protein